MRLHVTVSAFPVVIRKDSPESIYHVKYKFYCDGQFFKIWFYNCYLLLLSTCYDRYNVLATLNRFVVLS